MYYMYLYLLLLFILKDLLHFIVLVWFYLLYCDIFKNNYMENLITSMQSIKLKTMLDDQNVSIKNMDVIFDEIIPTPYVQGTKRKTQTFNQWVKLIFKK